MNPSRLPNFKPQILTAGVGLKAEHYQDVLAMQNDNTAPEGLWFEVHTENYFVDGGPRLEYLEAIRQHSPISFHGVGASLGGDTLPDKQHLKKVKALVERYQPTLVSEHAVWSTANGAYYADLMPLPRTERYLKQLINGVDSYQNGIGRRILIENPTNYLQFKSEMDEPEFLVEAATRAGCGILLDVNNLYLSSRNCGIDALDYIHRIPKNMIGEIHIAGFTVDPALGESLLIDSHDQAVDEEVWQLLNSALDRFGHTPVLLERDANIPPLKELLSEQQRAHQLLQHFSQPELSEAI